jgi:SAM-dependent methyltransferase
VVHAPPAGIGARTGSPGLSLTFGSSPEAVKEGYQRFYDGVTTQLDSTVFGDFSFFLNYGYVPNLSPQLSRVVLPDHFINKNSIRLVLEVIGDCSLSGRRILDVGCGRGGTVYVIHEFFDPASVVGLDLSPAAIGFCGRIHQYPCVSFHEGDAELLPFEDASFDVVTNIESSHSYPNIRAFYSEVYRVLSPGGHFLYTDVLAVEQWDANFEFLRSLGFVVRRDRDITSNVLLSCDEVAKSRVQAFAGGNDPHLMQNFLATPESEVYTEMRKRRWKYSILQIEKP